MIKNVVFDFGQVLVHFEPSYIVSRYVSDSADAELLERVVFDRLYWDGLDAGTVTNEDFIDSIRTRLPERLWGVADEIYYNWIYNIPEIEGIRQLIIDLKSKHRLYVFLLSNISRYFAEHAEEIPILKFFDKCIFSAVCGRVKPDRDIYEHLLAECKILPEETLFIDDRKENIEGAQKLGIRGYVFDGDVAKLCAYLEKVL